LVFKLSTGFFGKEKLNEKGDEGKHLGDKQVLFFFGFFLLLFLSVCHTQKRENKGDEGKHLARSFL